MKLTLKDEISIARGIAAFVLWLVALEDPSRARELVAAAAAQEARIREEADAITREYVRDDDHASPARAGR